MYSLSNPLEKYFSHGAESIETVEDSFLEKEKSPLVELKDQESLFHVQSSISSTKESFESKSQQVAEVSVKRDIQIFRSNYIARSEDKNITEELKYEYSEEVFESSASETIQHEEDDNICDQEGINLQDSFMRKKLALLSSSSGSVPCLHRMKGKEEMQEDHKEISDFCLRKIQLMSVEKPKSNRNVYHNRLLTTKKQIISQPVVGKKAKIESLKIDNVMHKMQKIKESNFHDPVHCSECRTQMSDIAKREFLKKKMEIVKRQEFEERLHMHLYQKDSACLIAEIIHSSLKPTAPPQEVWKKLLWRKDS